MRAFTNPVSAAQWLRDSVRSGVLQTDSRKVASGDGFLARVGRHTDARQHVAAAMLQGASACLVEQCGASQFGWATDARVASYLNLGDAMGDIATAYFADPSQLLKVVAVTGTNGKTSTAWWVAHALLNLEHDAYIPCGLIGTLGIALPLKHGAGSPAVPSQLAPENASLTTPDAVLLQATLRRMADAGLAACAMEASSIGLAEKRLAGTRVHTAIFTNFTQDHLDYHGSMTAYWDAKATLFAWPGLKSAVINIDDVKGAELARQLTQRPMRAVASVAVDGDTAADANANADDGANASAAIDVWTVSCTQPARLRASAITFLSSGLCFVVSEGAGQHGVSANVIGQFNVSNLLGVLAAMRSLGVPLALAAQACSRLQPVPGRMACLGGDKEPLVAVDYAHTPDALEQALLALRPMAQARGGQLVCVFGCGGDRDATKRPLMGAIAARLADRVVVTSDNPRSESPQSIVDQVVRGAQGCAHVTAQVDRALAIAQAVADAQAHDVILLAGKGHEDYQEVRGVKTPFSDTAIAAQALARRGLQLAAVTLAEASV